MPFGKNKGFSQRPKKKETVEAREEALDAAKELRDAKENAGQVAAALPSAPAEASPRAAKRKQAEDELIELVAESEVREQLAAAAKQQLALAQRLYEAKMRRLDASQAGKRHGNPHRELQRIYEAEIELLRAQRTCAEAQMESERADANLLGQQCHVLGLENANLQRSVRRLGGA